MTPLWCVGSSEHCTLVTREATGFGHVVEKGGFGHRPPLPSPFAALAKEGKHVSIRIGHFEAPEPPVDE